MIVEGGRAGGRVFLVDFGGVQAAAAGDVLSQGSTVIGTYGYMAPEQCVFSASEETQSMATLGVLIPWQISSEEYLRGTRMHCFLV